jgi:hypothetical protein
MTLSRKTPGQAIEAIKSEAAWCKVIASCWRGNAARADPHGLDALITFGFVQKERRAKW